MFPNAGLLASPPPSMNRFCSSDFVLNEENRAHSVFSKEARVALKRSVCIRMYCVNQCVFLYKKEKIRNSFFCEVSLRALLKIHGLER